MSILDAISAHELFRHLRAVTPETRLSGSPEAAYAEGLTSTHVSDETVRATLAGLGVRWHCARDWITSPDPAYAQEYGDATS